VKSNRSSAVLIGVGAVQVAGYLATIAWNVISARTLSVEGYGLFSFSIVIILTLQVVLGLGFQRGLVRFIPAYARSGDFATIAALRRKAVIQASTLGGVLTTVLSLCVVAGLDLDLDRLVADLWPFLALAGLGAALLDISAGYLIARHRAVAGAAASTTILPVVVLAVVVMAGLAGNTSAEQLVRAAALAQLSCGAVAGVLLFGAKAVGAANEAGVHQFKSFSKNALAIGLIYLGLSYLDRIMLASMGTFTDVGIYNLPARLARLFLIFVYFFNPIVSPVYGKWASRPDPRNALAIYASSSRLIATFVLPLALCCALFGREVITALAGPSYASGGPVLVILTVGTLAITLTGNNGLLLQMAGKENAELTVSGLSLVVNAILNALLIPKLGAMGAALATATALVVAAIVKTVVCHRVWRVWPGGVTDLRLMLATVAAITAVSAFRYYLAALNWGWLLVLCVVVYFTAVSPFRISRQIKQLTSGYAQDGSHSAAAGCDDAYN